MASSIMLICRASSSGRELSVSSWWGSIQELLASTNDEKRRNFVEIVGLQIGLKNYHP